mmetsp:Transcript_33411/g.68708  ORF Transcript_33411/g.68708 Transcript_33411/m.68708 type:complete len:223 (+) Transcript_33411:388-1056(+)
MLRPNTRTPQIIRQSLQPPKMTIAQTRHKLNVVNGWEVNLEQFEKRFFILGQLLGCQHFEEIGIIIPRMKGNPSHSIIQHQPTDHQQFPKMQGINSPRGMILKRNPGCYQQINGILSEHVITQIKLEIELPAGASLGEISIFVRECQSELDDFEEVDVAFEGFVVEVGGVGFGDGTGDDSGKFSVHCYVGVGFDEIADDGHFFFDVFFPYVADFESFPGRVA